MNNSVLFLFRFALVLNHRSQQLNPQQIEHHCQFKISGSEGWNFSVSSWFWLQTDWNQKRSALIWLIFSLFCIHNLCYFALHVVAVSKITQRCSQICLLWLLNMASKRNFRRDENWYRETKTENWYRNPQTLSFVVVEISRYPHYECRSGFKSEENMAFVWFKIMRFGETLWDSTKSSLALSMFVKGKIQHSINISAPKFKHGIFGSLCSRYGVRFSVKAIFVGASGWVEPVVVIFHGWKANGITIFYHKSEHFWRGSTQRWVRITSSGQQKPPPQNQSLLAQLNS